MRRGSIRQDSSGTWSYKCDIEPGKDGHRRVVHRRGFSTRDEASEALDQVLKSISETNRMPTECRWVYFIRAGDQGPIKIGVSCNPQERLRALQCGRADVLKLVGVMPGGIAQERVLHKKFYPSRMGEEWFQPTDDLMEVIALANELWG